MAGLERGQGAGRIAADAGVFFARQVVAHAQRGGPRHRKAPGLIAPDVAQRLARYAALHDGLRL